MKKFKNYRRKINYPLAEDSWGSSEIKKLINHLNSKQKLTYGKNVKKFEDKFSKYIGTKYSVMVNSGGSANLLSVLSLFFLKKNPLKASDEVIVPAVSWSTTYSPLSILGLKVKFVDIDLHTLNYNLNELEKNLSKGTKLIIIVNLLGNPNEFDRIIKLTKKLKIKPFIIEDNCESLGAKFNNKKTGSFGAISANSFFFSHHISTIEGGMLSTNNYEIYNLLLSLRSHGWTRELKKNNPLIKKNKDKFKENFNFILPGLNLRPTELNAISGLEQLKKINKFIKNRRKNYKVFKKCFENNKHLIIQKEIGISSWFGFSLIIKNKKIKRDNLVKFLSKNRIETRPIVGGNITKNKMIKYFQVKNSKNKIFENAEYIDKNGFFVGNSHKNLEKQIIYLKEKIDYFVEKSF